MVYVNACAEQWCTAPGKFNPRLSFSKTLDPSITILLFHH